MAKTTPQIRESGYFHINNGGVIYSIVEEQINSENVVVHQYFLKAVQSHMGVETTYTMPLYPTMAKYLFEALGRTVARISEQEQLEADNRGHEQVSWPGYKDTEVSVTVRDGQQVPSQQQVCVAVKCHGVGYTELLVPRTKINTSTG